MQKKQRDQKGKPDQQNKTNNMKKIPESDPYNLISSESSEYQELFNIIHTKRQNQAALKSQLTESNLVNIENQGQQIENPLLSLCLVCLEDNFEGGKCRLICGHVFCGDCTSYWQQISDKCPVCNKKVTEIIYQLDGQERTKKIRFTPFISNCQKCARNNDYNQMYFCDECNKGCIHIYCQTSLMNENKFEHWICENCIYQNYHDNKYQSELENVEREDQYQDDGFVVPDSFQDYRYDLEDVDSHEARSKKESKANQKKVLRPLGKKKDKTAKSKRR